MSRQMTYFIIIHVMLLTALNILTSHKPLLYLHESSLVVVVLLVAVVVERDGAPERGHPLLADVVVVGAEDEGLAARVRQDEHQTGVLALVELKVLLKLKEKIIFLPPRLFKGPFRADV